MSKPTIVIVGNDQDGYWGSCGEEMGLDISGYASTVDACENMLRQQLRRVNVVASPLVQVETKVG